MVWGAFDLVFFCCDLGLRATNNFELLSCSYLLTRYPRGAQVPAFLTQCRYNKPLILPNSPHHFGTLVHYTSE